MTLPLTDLDEVKANLYIILQSFGVKSGLSFPKADLYLDCRALADPSQVGMTSGDDPACQAFVRANSDTTPFMDLVQDSFSRLTTRRGAEMEFDKPFLILTMCAHGIHRSRAMKYILSQWLTEQGYKHVEVMK